MIKNVRQILPDWDTPARKAAYGKALYAYAKEMGFTDAEIKQFQPDGRIVLAMVKAMKFDNAKI
jgi:hypothetical protein